MKIEFPSKSLFVNHNQKMIHAPALALTFSYPSGNIRKEVLIDTCAWHSVFPLSLASQIGIHDVTQLPTIPIQSASGHFITGYSATVDMIIQDPYNSRRQFEWRAEILLAHITTNLYGVLGHVGFFEFFDFNLLRDRFQINQNAAFQGSITDFP